MLHDFLGANRNELIRRCRDKVAKRSAPRATEAELEHGVPAFLNQLIRTLEAEEQTPRTKTEKTLTSSKAGAISGPSEPDTSPSTSEIGKTATQYGAELMRKGFTVDQVIHGYGDLCQSVTELAVEHDAP